jgi:hypothetical protein
LTGIAEVVANQGVILRERPTGLTGDPESAKRRGIKLGSFFFLLTFLIVPLLAIISIALNIEPFLVVIGMFLFGGGGLLRVVYALMFESGSAATSTSGPHALPAGTDNRGALPPSRTTPASVYSSPAAGSWRDTNDLQPQPGSVTDSTTKLLQKEDQ